MNLIEQLGGYEKANSKLLKMDKILKEVYFSYSDAKKADDLRSALLEYRRENNIFEMGDYIIYENELMVFAMWSDHVKNCAYVGYAYAEDGFLANKDEFKHATDAEIEAGYRL